MEKTDRNVCVIGQGYVGLTLSTLLAQSGFRVVGLERNKEKLQALRDNDPYVKEPRLENLIASQRARGHLSFEPSAKNPRAEECSAYILAVGSPLNEDKEPRTEIVESAVEEIGKVLRDDDVVIVRSTVPVGTTRRLGRTLEDITGMEMGSDFLLSMAPERTVQGNALDELQKLPQIVGGLNEESTLRTEVIFREITDTIVRVERPEAAEIIKCFDNTYRDVNIALGNAFGEIARHYGLDGQRVIESANTGYDRNDIKKPGAGVGGGCLPKDPYLLLSGIDDERPILEYATRLIRTGRLINERMPEKTVDLIQSGLSETNREGEEIDSLILGVAFKGTPPTNDVRGTPAEPIISFLRKHGDVAAFDPAVEEDKIRSLGASPISLSSVQELNQSLSDSTYDVYVVANNNPMFRELNVLEARTANQRDPIFVDGWGVFPPKMVEEAGYCYRGVGRPA